MLMTGASVFLIVSGIVTTVEMNTAEDDKKSLSWSSLFCLFRKVGFSITEIDEMDIGFMLDIALQTGLDAQRATEPKKPKVRKATQADFDRM